MSNKLKDFLYPTKDPNDLETATITLKKEDITTSNTNNIKKNSSPNIFTPRVFAEVESVANVLLSGTGVIVDLTSTEINEAKRICDFLNGVTFAIDGKVNKIARLVYLFAPKQVK